MKRLFLFGVAIAAVTLSVFISQGVWKEAGLRSQQALNEQRIQLVANALKAEIGRQDHLPIVLALDAEVQAALRDPADPKAADRLSRKLARLSREADTRALYVIDSSGNVISSDDWESRQSRVGQNLRGRSYFQNALKNGRSTYLGVEALDDNVRYYIAEAVGDKPAIGVTVVRIEFDQLESAWHRGGERVLVTDSNGVVFLASDSVYKFRKFGGPESLAKNVESSQFPTVEKPAIEFDLIERRASNSIIEMKAPEDGGRFLYQTMTLPEYGWTIHRFSSLDSINADQRDGGVIGGALSALIIFLVLYLIQRHRAYVAARETGNLLKSEVQRTTRELRETNASLQTEIDERRRTEVRLRETQNELVQAGKLAALGQMSAAIAHEINQPLAAIRTFVASTGIFLERGDVGKVSGNLGTINKLAERMAIITSHLKTFARKSEPGHPLPVLVAQAIDDALLLTDSQIKGIGARVETTIVTPDALINGYSVQLEQVMINLINNALDAVAATAMPWIGIRVWSSDDTVFITVADNGPGIAPELMDRIFEPFMTTKPLGRGLGLGLSISYGIVQDFHGQIRCSNRPEGGAEIMIELPRLSSASAALVGNVHA